MKKLISTISFAIILLISAIQIQAAELKVGKDLVIKQDSSKKASTIQDRIEMQAKPYDDVKISNRLSAGVITEKEDYSMENIQRGPTKKKGNEVGVGISLSF